MKKILFFILCLPLWFTACNIHEWPVVEEVVPVQLSVEYNIQHLTWTGWDYMEGDEGSSSVGDTYANEIKEGKLRYTIRTFPVSGTSRSSDGIYQEHVFIKDVTDHSGLNETLYLPAGEYNVVVWADYMKKSTDEGYYQLDDFSEIKLNDNSIGNNDYHDAYRGVCNITLVSDVYQGNSVVSNIEMQRPLAKLELITTDLDKFLGKGKVKSISEKQINNVGNHPETVDLEDYKVVFYYVGYRPIAYSMFADRPVDSVTGAFFESTLKRLNENEASLGFDYIFVNGTESAVTVQIGIYDKKGNQLSLTDPIKIPLKRNFHTKMYGEFLTSNTSGGVHITPDYDGDHNLILP